jgi:hypothetical protein
MISELFPLNPTAIAMVAVRTVTIYLVVLIANAPDSRRSPGAGEHEA